MLGNFGDNFYKSAMMMPLNFAKLTLFFIVLTSLATSQPFSRSHGAASRHTGFQWNTRKIGNKNVATISKRRDEERDRRSVPLADADSTFHKAFGSHSSEVPLDSERRHHSHHHHHQQHHHRHHHGEEEEAIVAADDSEVVNDGGGREEGEEEEKEIRGNNRSKGKERYRTRLDSSEIYEEEEEDEEEEDKPLNIFNPERLRFSGAPLGELRMPEGVDTRRLQQILASTGLEIEADVFKNVTTPAPEGQESNEGGRQGGKKNKKRSKKVKRDRRRKRNKGKKGKKGKKNNRNVRKCRHLKGKQKKECRTEANMFSFIKENISMSGSEACQYHNLEKCCRQVGFLGLDTDELPAVRKCHYRKLFLDCMQEQLKVTCDPNFETSGDMKALRMKIRNVIWTTDSCLISEVVEG